MQQVGLIDCLIPRGGASLIASIKEHATVPFVIDGDGNCHVSPSEYGRLVSTTDWKFGPAAAAETASSGFVSSTYWESWSSTPSSVTRLRM